MTLKRYRVLVTEKHTDYVWVEAESQEEARRTAHAHSECEYTGNYDCLVVAEEEIE